MAAKALPFIPSAIEQVTVCMKSADFDHGILITFSDNRTAYFDGSWLYDQRDVCGNFVVNEDEPDI
jgi:hypothetical protein